ncbi:MAG: hypothetical protein H6735_14425 [Alphaproteobacteria bacterium]|nr:hypothetical protein [Alphaproteobacteria bacterium]
MLPGPLDPPPLARPGETPVALLYARLDEADGRVSGRWRRRREAEYEVFELGDGTVVRWIRTRKGVVEDHQLDASGRPSVTVDSEGGVPVRAVAHGASDVTVDLAGWVAASGPIGRVTVPAAPKPRDGGGWSVEALGGTLEAWLDQPSDPTAPAFVEGLLAGSGADLADRATVWVDGRPSVRFALLAGDRPASVWAVPVDSGTLVLAWWGRATDDPVDAWLATRVLAALVDLDAPPVEVP